MINKIMQLTKEDYKNLIKEFNEIVQSCKFRCNTLQMRTELKNQLDTLFNRYGIDDLHIFPMINRWDERMLILDGPDNFARYFLATALDEENSKFIN